MKLSIPYSSHALTLVLVTSYEESEKIATKNAKLEEYSQQLSVQVIGLISENNII